jgi:hypothetical protein
MSIDLFHTKWIPIFYWLLSLIKYYNLLRINYNNHKPQLIIGFEGIFLIFKVMKIPKMLEIFLRNTYKYHEF